MKKLQKKRIWLSLLALCLLLSSCGAGSSEAFEPLHEKTQNNISGTDFRSVASNEALELEINPDTTDIRVRVKKTGYVWSTDQKAEGDLISYSLFSLVYRDQKGSIGEMDSFADSVAKGQYLIEELSGGVRVRYTLGTVDTAYIYPSSLIPERYEYFLERCDEDQKYLMEMVYRFIDFTEYDEETAANLSEEYPHAVNSQIYALRSENPDDALKEEMSLMFEDIGYKKDDLITDHSAQEEESADTPLFNLTVEYILNGDSLTVRLPQEGIQRSDGVFIETLSVFKCFKGPESDDGYFLLPDGSGSVMNYNNGRAGNYSVRIYGREKTLSTENRLLNQNDGVLNVFGCRESTNAYFTVIEDSDSHAVVNAVSGSSGVTPRVYTTFDIETADYMRASSKHQVESDMKMTVHQSRRYKGNISLQYYFLSGEDADYSGMARRFKNILFGQSEKKQPEHYPLFVEIISTVGSTETVAGISFKKDEVLTSFESAGDIAGTLRKDVEALDVILSGWSNGGYRHTLLNKEIKPERSAGGREGLARLVSRLKEKDIGFFLEADIQYSYYQPSGLKSLNRKYTAEMLGGARALLFDYDLDVFQQKNQALGYILTPSTVSGALKSLQSFLKKAEITGTALRNTGSDLNADYSDRSFTDRQDAEAMIKDGLSAAKKDGISLIASRGNAYVLPYIDKLMEMPVQNDRLDVTDYSVPFLAMVISGVINYSGPVVNGNGNEELLRLIENAAAPYCALTEASTVHSATGYYKKLTASHFEPYKKTLLEHYNYLNEALGEFYGKPILRHDRISEGVFRTSFDNGTVYVNYSSSDVTTDGITVPSAGYAVRKGGI